MNIYFTHQSIIYSPALVTSSLPSSDSISKDRFVISPNSYKNINIYTTNSVIYNPNINLAPGLRLLPDSPISLCEPPDQTSTTTPTTTPTPTPTPESCCGIVELVERENGTTYIPTLQLTNTTFIFNTQSLLGTNYWGWSPWNCNTNSPVNDYFELDNNPGLGFSVIYAPFINQWQLKVSMTNTDCSLEIEAFAPYNNFSVVAGSGGNRIIGNATNLAVSDLQFGSGDAPEWASITMNVSINSDGLATVTLD